MPNPIKLSNITRRNFIAGSIGIPPALLPLSVLEVTRVSNSPLKRKMHLGIVTYNVAKDWTLDQILANCKAAGVEGVEFRTTHKHEVEPSLTSDQRKGVRDKCAAAGLLQISLGSVCEFQATESEVVT